MITFVAVPGKLLQTLPDYRIADDSIARRKVISISSNTEGTAVSLQSGSILALTTAVVGCRARKTQLKRICKRQSVCRRASEDADDMTGYGRKDLGPGGKDPEGKYTWERCGLEVVVSISLTDDISKKDIKTKFLDREVSVSLQEEVIFKGEPGCELQGEECFWEIGEDKGGQRCLMVHLLKKGWNSRWPDSLLK
eukprot:TRINITY_DN80350_c0_g1_i1.p1 TRINITY_DN80350_c0_g1~~TRINITY_DN80350_c0_g1_i1.p1  ORF type:complete len:195 (-),score=30.55 TRINITY_DN80350_c0_g1_i1:180-764(-)